MKELFNNRWNKFESNISDLVDSDSPPLRLDMLVAGTEKHYAHTYQPGRFAGRMVNQRVLDAEATTHTSMYGKSEFTIRGILCRKVTNREDQELKFHVLDPRVIDGEQRVVHRARSIRALMNILTEDGIKSLKDFATCADWELAGGYTSKDGKRVKDEGLLEKFDMTLGEAQQLIMKAREMVGWVSKEESEDIIKSLKADD